VQTAEEALAQDAADYAKRQGVSVEEGVRRLRAQAESVVVTDELRRTYAARLAGIVIEHQPVFRIRVLLTGDGPVADRLIDLGGMRVPILFQAGARTTGDQVLAAIYRHRDAIGRILNHDGLGHDPRTGSMIVMADRADLGTVSPETMAARIQAVAGVPVTIRILDRPSEDLSLIGGGRVEGENGSDGKRYFCTTGYVVTDGQRGGVRTSRSMSAALSTAPCSERATRCALSLASASAPAPGRARPSATAARRAAIAAPRWTWSTMLHPARFAAVYATRPG
jgi:hypothetical protein